MRIISTLNKYIKNMEGKIVGIGLSNASLLSEINKNNKILECDLLESIDINKSGDDNNKKNKKKYVKNMKKKYKKKKVDYMLINLEVAEKYLKRLIRDSIYINKNVIYCYCDKKYDYEKIIKRYNRYDTKIELLELEDGKIIKINTTKAKNNMLKDFFYYILDTLNNIADLIGDLLVG